MEKDTGNGVLEDFRIQFLECWQRLPNKALFLVLLVAWLALFQFLGNATLGYINTPSLLTWMRIAYVSNPDANGSDDSHGKLIPFVVIALFWWKRKQLMALSLRAWWPGLLLVALAGLAALVQMLDLPVPVRRPSGVSEQHINGSRRDQGAWTVFDKRYWPADTFERLTGRCASNRLKAC